MSTASRLDTGRASDVPAGMWYQVQGNLLGALTRTGVQALATDRDLVTAVANLILDHIREWGEPEEVTLSGAWREVISSAARLRLPRVRGVDGGYRGIELNRFLGYSGTGNATREWQQEIVRIIPGSEWLTIHAGYGVQIKAHDTDPAKILIRYAQKN